MTRPLSAALDAGRINHAYLFSGPRGCGKTSSARIMARSLNCEQGPTSTPCGVCPSCVSLAPGGPGNLDVTELDAASHNGVEDMRELRDRAYYAPAESRYRIFIIDEAHMISTSGANALLKVVEEPPEHVIFIFATTEPEKIIGTIRSRTHHYPFRLLTPPAMKGLLQRIVAEEGVHVDDAVYPMVIEAGGGSPRDTLSTLDQLLAGAGPEGLTYDVARPLLGVTDESLLDDTIAALASGDKAALFTLIDAVVEAGHEPRRFAIDLLDHLRDLMVLQAVPDAITEGLVSAPTARAEMLTAQAQQFTGPHLAYLAATVNSEIANLRGATSPRLLLEILAARLVATPSTAASAGSSAGVSAPAFAPPAGAGAPATAGAAAQPEAGESVTASATDDASAGAALLRARRARAQAQQKDTAAASAPQAQQPQPVPQSAPQSAAVSAPQPEPQPAAEPASQPAVEPVSAPAAEPTPVAQQAPATEESAPTQQTQSTQQAPVDGELLETIRTQWAQLRGAVGERNKTAEIMLTEARVLGLRGDTLVLGHTTGALAHRINAESNNQDIVAVLADKVRPGLAVECVIGTDPAVVGLPPLASPQAAWNPNQPSREESADEQEPESPSPTAPQDKDEPAPQESAAQPTAAVEEAPQAPAQSGWGQPAPIGQEVAATAAAPSGGAPGGGAARSRRRGSHPWSASLRARRR